jgi:dienelactone hydrolase
MHGALPIESFEPFGIQGWPTGVPMQVHYAVEDPWVEGRNVAAVRAAVQRAGVGFEAYTYPGSGHLFADPDLPEHDAASSELMWRRVLEFVDRVATRK